MRKWNNRLVMLILVLFLLHGVMGCLELLGISTVSIWQMSWILLLAVVVHAVIGILCTVRSVRSGAGGKKWYLKENTGFWVKRLSGIAILILLVLHLSAYKVSVNDVFFFREFTALQMLSQILFVLAIFIHIFVSLKAMLIAKGVVKFRQRKTDWMLVLTVCMLFFIFSIVFYFIHWQLT